jgi:hypothetical protein
MPCAFVIACYQTRGADELYKHGRGPIPGQKLACLLDGAGDQSTAVMAALISARTEMAKDEAAFCAVLRESNPVEVWPR